MSEIPGLCSMVGSEVGLAEGPYEGIEVGSGVGNFVGTGVGPYLRRRVVGRGLHEHVRAFGSTFSISCVTSLS